MISRWNEQEAQAFIKNPLTLRAYTSRLLGQEASLVLHGGGNTSVKVTEANLFGEKEDLLYVKGSGWDLKTIEPQGFAPVKMDILFKLSRLEKLSDSDMVRAQKAAMTDPAAPGPSVEAILHAIIPFKFVDHTHADAVVTVSNQPDGEKRIREIYGDRTLIVPYVMPGFILARKIYELIHDLDWTKIDSLILLNHGVFTFSDEAKVAYENMIKVVSRAEDYLTKLKANAVADKKIDPSAQSKENLLDLAQTRRALGGLTKNPVILSWDFSTEAVGFSNLKNVEELACRGTVTPDHVIHIKPFPLIHRGDVASELKSYTEKYQNYFKRNATDGLTMLNAAPRWIIWPEHGVISASSTFKSAQVIGDITKHTRKAIQWGENLGQWQPVKENDLFEVEYWELEQAKLKKSSGAPVLQGKVALVTGAASGIGKACVESLLKDGACVVALDINPEITKLSTKAEFKGLVCDVTNAGQVKNAIYECVKTFGGLDILVSNAGSFPPGIKIEDLDEATWTKTLNVNLSSHYLVLQNSIPFLKLGFEPAVVIIASKNVSAPGPGAAAYSVSKSGLTQLARVAALELAPQGIRVNILHPDAVFDTGVWTQEVLENRAKHYAMSVEDYKTKNLLHTEISSKDVAQLVSAMAGPLFLKTTGAQIPIDGGNDRVI